MKAFLFGGKKPKAPAVPTALTTRSQPVDFDFGNNHDDEAATPAQAAAINITGRNPTRKRALAETQAFQAPLAPAIKAHTHCDAQALPDGDEVPADSAAQLRIESVLRHTAAAVGAGASFGEADCNTRQNIVAYLGTLQHTTTPIRPAARSCEGGGGVDKAVFGVFTVRTTSDGCVYTLKGKRCGDAMRAGNGGESALQYAATHCTAPQPTPTRCTTVKTSAASGGMLQHATTHCNALQRTATHCNTKETCAEEFETKSERTKEFETKNGMGTEMQVKPHVPGLPTVNSLLANPHAHGHTYQHTHTRAHTHTHAPATQNQPGTHSQKSALGQIYCIT